MKKAFLLTLVASMFLVAFQSETKEGQLNNNKELDNETTVIQSKSTHQVLLNKSEVLWKGYKPTGSHHGIITISKGEITYEDNTLKDAYFEIDMNSITDTDMEADDSYNKMLVDHLKSADFFDTKQYPRATFSMSGLTADKSGQLHISGDFTIKGITKSITFPISLKESDNKIEFQAAAFKINRTDFGIKYKSKNFFTNLKDKFINDEFDVSFNVVLEAK